ncbi:hypothetical protein PHYSODRAFT_450284, partial [Phytophthora sojae]
LESAWEMDTTSPFPSVPADTRRWNNAVVEAPRILLMLLQSFESPEYILSTMTDTVLDKWTKQSRLDCLVHCLESWAAKPGLEDGRAKWLLERCAELRGLASSNPDALDLHAPALWNSLKAASYGDSQLLQLYQKSEAPILSKMVVASFIYEAELRLLASK